MIQTTDGARFKRAISILRLLKIQGIKRRMNQLRLRPDSAVELLLG